MALIKNDVVSMDWEAEQFFETKEGFVAAIREYQTEKGNVAIIFQDKVAYLLLDEDNNPASVEDCSEAIKNIYKEGLSAEDLYPDSYVELGTTVVLDDGADTARYYGLSDGDIEDINKRLDDLSGYWAIIEQSMFGDD